MQHVAFDAHKRSTLASVAQLDGQLVREERVEKLMARGARLYGAWRIVP